MLWVPSVKSKEERECVRVMGREKNGFRPHSEPYSSSSVLFTGSECSNIPVGNFLHTFINARNTQSELYVMSMGVVILSKICIIFRSLHYMRENSK